MVVDVGCGSGRFAVAVRRQGFCGEVIAIDIDPTATLMSRAHLAAAGFTKASVVQGDFLRCCPGPSQHPGRTAFIGNPPYVRHHTLGREAKAWARKTGKALDMRVSGLAGLHVLFMLAIARLSRPGDAGCLITASEWLDVGYGAVVRELLSTRLGCVRLDVIDPEAVTFDDAMATAVVASWQVGYSGTVAVRRARDPKALGELTGGKTLTQETLSRSTRWRDLLRPTPQPDGLVPLGTYARVHRGVATGANAFFVLPRDEAIVRGLERHVYPCATRASQIILGDGTIRAEKLEYVLLDADKGDDEDPALRAYLTEGKRHQIPERYLCAHRHPWWRVGGSQPPPIVATYMARRPPVFATNPDRCRIVNVLHGIYFRDIVDEQTAATLVTWLNSHAEQLAGGRMYHGGLRKFEPRELEAILVPPLRELARGQRD